MPVIKQTLLPIVLTAFLNGAHSASPHAPLLGSVITHPEQISGIWESENTQPVLGLNIQLTTKIFGQRTTLSGVPQHVSEVFVGLYERNDISSIWPRRFLAADSESVQVTSRTIQVHQAGVMAKDAVDLNLIFDPLHDQWSGMTRMDNIAGRITFSRPHPDSGTAKTALVGTWEHFDPLPICLHVAQQSISSMVAWSDQLQLPGLIRCANRSKPPSEAVERYGVMSQVDLASPSSMLIQLGAFAAGGTSHTEIGKLTTNPNVMSAGQAMEPWRRIPGDSCAGEGVVLRSPARKAH